MKTWCHIHWFHPVYHKKSPNNRIQTGKESKLYCTVQHAFSLRKMGIECNLTCMVMIFFTSSSLHLIVCQQLKLSMCAVYQSMLSCPKQKRHRFTMFMSRKFGSKSNRLAGYKGYLLGWNQLGNNKMSLQTDPRQINLKLFIQYQNTMLNLQLYHFSYVIMYNNYVIRRLHITKLQLIINHGK